MRIEQVTLQTETAPLDGLWFTPEPAPARGAALLMHGNQGNFYVGPPRFLPPALAGIGLASLVSCSAPPSGCLPRYVARMSWPRRL